MKITRSWVGKKEPTNPDKKEAHQQRKHRKTILNEISDTEIARVLENLVSNFTTHDLQEGLSYARKFDWLSIADKTKKVYESI
mgnify:CR=1 FL=1